MGVIMSGSKKKDGGGVSPPDTVHCVSGSYTSNSIIDPGLPTAFVSLVLRLDVDGWYPQRVFSVVVRKKRGKEAVALIKITRREKCCYRGTVLKKWGGSFPFGKNCSVRIEKDDSGEYTLFLSAVRPDGRRCRIRFLRTSHTFRTVVFEYDRVKGTRGITAVNPVEHPVRNLSLPSEVIDIKGVYRRAGIELDVALQHSVVPAMLSGDDHAWSRRELHDAMQSYWSHFSKVPQWSMWALFADRYAESNAVAGMMFDTNHKVQRRAVALFNQSVLFNEPPDDPAPAQWRKRMRFFTICHEIGHVFNLAHSSDKESGRTWLAARNNPLADSFMNNPHLYEYGLEQFFRDFSFRFDDDELCFLRHAPDEFVEPGNSAWFENHALSLDGQSAGKTFSFVLRTGRGGNRYRFMEPVVIECRITNTTATTVSINMDEEMIVDRMRLCVRRCSDGKTVRIAPYSTGEYARVHRELLPKMSLYGSLFVSADTGGWIIAEPGKYEVRAEIRVNHERLVSNLLQVVVTKPKTRLLEKISCDYFSEDVGRVLAFDGSRILENANSVLHRCCEADIPEEVAVHARVALALPLQGESKQLRFRENRQMGLQPEVITVTGDRVFSTRTMGKVFFGSGIRAAVTLGNIDFRKYADAYCNWLLGQGQRDDALSVQEMLYKTLTVRGVRKEYVLGPVAQKLHDLRSGKWPME